MGGFFYFYQGSYLFRSDIELPFKPANLPPTQLKTIESNTDFNILEITTTNQIPEFAHTEFKHELATLVIHDKTAYIQFKPSVTLENKQLFIYRFVIPSLLKQKGLIVLHASAMVLNGNVTIVIGPSGSGKSLYTANKIKEGAQLYADDLLFLEYHQGEIYASGGQPVFHLDASSLEKLNVKKMDTFPVHGSTKRSLQARVIGGEQVTHKLPITELLFLAGIGETISTLSKAECLKSLLDAEYEMPWLEEETLSYQKKLQQLTVLTTLTTALIH